MDRKPVVFVTLMKSDGDPDKVYEVKQFVDGSRWCTCPSYKFQKLPPDSPLRSCKHTRRLDGAILGHALRALR